ncbi:MAG TPA: ABC transporter permease [Kofleriaceae bacterium]
MSRRPNTLVSGILVAALIAIAVLSPWLGGSDATELDIAGGLTELGAPLPPSSDSFLGTDHLGRDVWARLVAGAGTSLAIATFATLIALTIGVAVGLVAGYAGGVVDEVLMRVVDLVLSFPFLLLAILLAALLRARGLADSSLPVIVTLGVAGWTTMARVIRGKTASLARSEMVVAAHALGASPTRIMLRHVLPNVTGVIAVVATLGFAQNLLAESVLSYLGLGLPPPAPSWGRMLYEGRPYYRSAPHLVLAPGIAILVAVVAFNLLGEALRERFDRRGR